MMDLNSEMSDSISVIIPTFNRKHTLEKVIKSYLCQNNYHELIFVDDGSTDDTYEYLLKIAKSFDNIKVIKHTENLGHPAARNTGIEKAEGRYIMFGEDDVYLAEEYILTLLECLKKSDADLIAGRIMYLKKDEGLEECLLRHNKYNNGSIMNYWFMHPKWSGKIDNDIELPYLHSVALGKKEVYRNIGFDHMLFAREGTDFYARAGKQGHRIIFCPHTACFHLMRDKGRGGTWKTGAIKYQFLATRDNNKLINRHYDYFKKLGMKGNKFTFKFLHVLNKVRLLYLYYLNSTKH